MKKVVAVVAVLVIIAIGVILFSTNKKTNNNTATKSSSTTSQSANQSATQPMETQSQANTAPQPTSVVTIKDMAFSPGGITVKKGTTVTWTNKDAVAHTVVESDGKTGPKSSDLATGQSYSFTYTATGTFNYHCSIHPSMTGTVTVTE